MLPPLSELPLPRPPFPRLLDPISPETPALLPASSGWYVIVNAALSSLLCVPGECPGLWRHLGNLRLAPPAPAASVCLAAATPAAAVTPTQSDLCFDKVVLSETF